MRTARQTIEAAATVLLDLLDTAEAALARDGARLPDDWRAVSRALKGVRPRQEATTLDDGRKPVDGGGDDDVLLLDLHGAARRLSVSVRTVQRLVADGRLPAVRVMGVRRVRVSDIETFVAALDEDRCA